MCVSRLSLAYTRTLKRAHLPSTAQSRTSQEAIALSSPIPSQKLTSLRSQRSLPLPSPTSNTFPNSQTSQNQ
ncbi:MULTISPECIES: hypothetical protein [unclassified Coleofasciculus]|uniref:hypothetical protein n=1 Tax=unclassified Coleofasciculus TaxID=2692782 RepID=UPI00187E74BB|nr:MULTISPECIES: hypothetical protein [unclassified Coleofasciculus]MBE9150266.1 hypothetical protein [Coleofasciculus sp. LEGE 07092]